MLAPVKWKAEINGKGLSLFISQWLSAYEHTVYAYAECAEEPIKRGIKSVCPEMNASLATPPYCRLSQLGT